MIRQSFTSHSHNRGSRSAHFKTTNVAALTPYAAERRHTRVTNLSGGSINAAPQLAIENDPAAHSCSQRQTNDRAIAAACSLPQFSQCRRVRIVLDQDRRL